MRGRLYVAFKRANFSKENSKTEKMLGVDLATAKKHIDRQFKKGMSWANFGEWQIDHIVPLSSAKTIEEMEILCHYKNLQPPWKADNLKKHDTIVETQLYIAI